MIAKGSRYEQVRRFAAGAPFPGVRAREIAPAPPVLEHTVEAGDRLDHLARHYYGDDRLWWRILDANPGVLYGGDLLRESAAALPWSAGSLLLERQVGQAILIPRARD